MNEVPAKVLWVKNQDIAVSFGSGNTETIGWRDSDWSPLFSIQNEICLPLNDENSNFAGVHLNKTLKYCGNLDHESTFRSLDTKVRTGLVGIFIVLVDI